MALLEIAEVFGNDTAHLLPVDVRSLPYCPFMDSECTKVSRTKPLGICSYTDGLRATAVCPVRMRQGNRLFTDVGRAAFGAGRQILIVPEVRLLRIPNSGKKIGKIDFLLALLNDLDEPVDFVPLEIQTVYVSGASTRAAFDKYLETGLFFRDSRRRPDFRSSAQKRLMPQLSIKVPVFRRWGKRFYIAVDGSFFDELPKLKQTAEDSAEITWFVYPFLRSDAGFFMGEPKVIHTQWEDVLTSLREGEAPSKEEIFDELRRFRKALGSDRKSVSNVSSFLT